MMRGLAETRALFVKPVNGQHGRSHICKAAAPARSFHGRTAARGPRLPAVFTDAQPRAGRASNRTGARVAQAEQPFYGLQEKLAAARATWLTSGVVDYRLQYDWDNDVKAQVVVRAGSEPAVTPADAIAWTVPKLFDEVESYLHQPGVAPSVTYDADLGYVVGLVREEGCAGSLRVNGIEVAPLR